MWNLIKRLSEKYRSWVGDSELERTIRKHLIGRGFYGDTAQFKSCRLVAVQRPGWLQIFSFSVEAKPAIDDEDDSAVPNNAGKKLLFGLAKQDARYNRCEIQVFEEPNPRNILFEQWSEDLIRLRNPQM